MPLRGDVSKVDRGQQAPLAARPVVVTLGGEGCVDDYLVVEILAESGVCVERVLTPAGVLVAGQRACGFACRAVRLAAVVDRPREVRTVVQPPPCLQRVRLAGIHFPDIERLAAVRHVVERAVGQYAAKRLRLRIAVIGVFSPNVRPGRQAVVEREVVHQRARVKTVGGVYRACGGLTVFGIGVCGVIAKDKAVLVGEVVAEREAQAVVVAVGHGALQRRYVVYRTVGEAVVRGYGRGGVRLAMVERIHKVGCQLPAGIHYGGALLERRPAALVVCGERLARKRLPPGGLVFQVYVDAGSADLVARRCVIHHLYILQPVLRHALQQQGELLLRQACGASVEYQRYRLA